MQQNWKITLSSILIQTLCPCPNHITFGCPVVTTDISLIKLVNKLNICQEDRAQKSFVHTLAKKTHLSASYILKQRLLVISSATLFSALCLTRSKKSCLNSGISLAHRPPYAPEFYWMRRRPSQKNFYNSYYIVVRCKWWYARPMSMALTFINYYSKQHFIEQSVRSWTSGLNSSYSSF